MAPFHSHPVYFPPSANENKSSLPSLPPHIISTVLVDEPVTDSKQPKTAPHLSYQSDSDTSPVKNLRDDEEYIVKDHWVKGNSDAILNEVKMLEEMKGVIGILRLVEYWLVQAEEGQPDETQRYYNKIENSTVGTYCTHVHLVLQPQARPLYMFRSKKELLRVLRDTVLKDCEGNSRGSLIDWEVASCITSDNTYPISRMGMIPFMSIDLLIRWAKYNSCKARWEQQITRRDRKYRKYVRTCNNAATHLTSLEMIFSYLEVESLLFRTAFNVHPRLLQLIPRPRDVTFTLTEEQLQLMYFTWASAQIRMHQEVYRPEVLLQLHPQPPVLSEVMCAMIVLWIARENQIFEMEMQELEHLLGLQG
ncbi:hypothetical protein C8R48DRAFT_670986 [Suillus tomentosus]|nr:hypothetical protein C8R48DRAFT_670986 [Suillus tomentosus]